MAQAEQPKRLAIVDDHALFLQGLGYLFEQGPLDVEVALFTTGTAFLAAVDQGQVFDIVITDLAMKQINGIALIAALRARDIGVPVIVLSASEDAITRSNADLVGAFSFVHKSCEQEVLFDAVAAASEASPLPARSMRQGTRRSVFHDDGTDTVLRPKLGEQQQRILALMAQGLTNKVIAGELAISENTVKTHVKTIYRELSVNNRAAAIQRARELALF
jgi:DNA-binding NarL/FixJ family response regulator